MVPVIASSSTGSSLIYLAEGIGIIIAAAVTGFVTWRISKRTTSGSTRTSDAATLWGASEQMRHDLVADLLAMRNDVTASRTETAEARAQTELLRTEAERARGEVLALNTAMSELRSEIVQLHSQLTVFQGLDEKAATERDALINAVQATKDLLEYFTEHGIPPPTSAAITETAAIKPGADKP